MRIRSVIVLTAAAALLAGCGASPFRSTVLEACQTSGDAEHQDCECLAGRLDDQLDDTTKKALLVTIDRDIFRDAAKKKAAIAAAGLTEEQFNAALKAADPVLTAAEKACKKPKPG